MKKLLFYFLLTYSAYMFGVQQGQQVTHITFTDKTVEVDSIAQQLKKERLK